MKIRTNKRLETCIGYTTKLYGSNTPFSGNYYIREDVYFNIIVDSKNIVMKKVKHNNSTHLTEAILLKDMVIKNAYEKSLPI